MSSSDLLYRIALTMVPDIGAITAKKLLAETGSARAVFEEKYHNLMHIPGIGSYLAKRIVSSHVMHEAEKELDFIASKKILPLYFLDENYPDRLKQCLDGPILLYLKGEKILARSKILSVVGTRRSSPQGKEICMNIISSLADRHPDLVIISGLAYGIDITAHRSALSKNLKTYAVLGHGLSHMYPFEHREYAKQMIRNGGLLTDFHSRVKPERNNFIRRNRIIAGLSEATLVVESGLKGGALITAGMAHSYHREVMAIPGRPSDRSSAGCNDLIKRNVASLVESAKDVEYVMNWEQAGPPFRQTRIRMISFSREEQKILEAIKSNPTLQPETISKATSLPIHSVISHLIEMELHGWITPMPGNMYHLHINLD